MSSQDIGGESLRQALIGLCVYFRAIACAKFCKSEILIVNLILDLGWIRPRLIMARTKAAPVQLFPGTLEKWAGLARQRFYAAIDELVKGGVIYERGGGYFLNPRWQDWMHGDTGKLRIAQTCYHFITTGCPENGTPHECIDTESGQVDTESGQTAGVENGLLAGAHIEPAQGQAGGLIEKNCDCLGSCKCVCVSLTSDKSNPATRAPAAKADHVPETRPRRKDTDAPAGSYTESIEETIDRINVDIKTQTHTHTDTHYNSDYSFPGDYEPDNGLIAAAVRLAENFMASTNIAYELGRYRRVYPSRWIVDAVKRTYCINPRASNWGYTHKTLKEWTALGEKNPGPEDEFDDEMRPRATVISFSDNNHKQPTDSKANGDVNDSFAAMFDDNYTRKGII